MSGNVIQINVLSLKSVTFHIWYKHNFIQCTFRINCPFIPNFIYSVHCSRSTVSWFRLFAIIIMGSALVILIVYHFNFNVLSYKFLYLSYLWVEIYYFKYPCRLSQYIMDLFGKKRYLTINQRLLQRNLGMFSYEVRLQKSNKIENDQEKYKKRNPKVGKYIKSKIL